MDISSNPNFKAYFGDYDDPDAFTTKYKGTNPPSVALDSDKPLVVYHATVNDFKAFEIGRETTNSNFLGPYKTKRYAIFVTPNSDFAQEYIQDEKGGRVLPLYLNMKCPLDLTGQSRWEQADELETVGINPRWFTKIQHDWELFDDDDGKMFVDACKILGYDGVIFNEENQEGNSILVYAVFSSNQLKSALGNKGTFNMNSNNIDESTVKDIALNPNFKTWFGNSKVKDKFGKPRVVYHGSLSDFEEFNLEKISPESYFGKGFYFTSSKVDVNSNYSTYEGPDIKNRIERIFDYDDDLNAELNTKFKKDYGSGINTTRDKTTALRKYGDVDIDNEGSVYPCYLKMENPCYVGFGKQDTFFDYQDNYEYDDETEEETYNDPTGKAAEAIMFLSDYADDLSPIYESLVDNDGIYASVLLSLMIKNHEINNIDDDQYAGGVFSDMLHYMDYDGIIQRPESTWPNMTGIKDSIHYIVFNPNQVKSALGNNGNFSLNSNNIKESKFNESINYSHYEKDLAPDLFKFLCDIDPTTDKKYTRWIIEHFMKEYVKPAIGSSRRYLGSFLSPVKADETMHTIIYSTKPWGIFEIQKFPSHGGNLLARFINEDYYKITEDLKKYIKLKNKKILDQEESNIMNIKDIQALTFMVNVKYRAALEELEANAPIGNNEYNKLYEDDNWLLVVPLTEAAAIKYGANTKWCTAAKDHEHNMFDYYTKEEYPNSKLYIIINKTPKMAGVLTGNYQNIERQKIKNNRKWQIHLESGQWMDERDSNIEDRNRLIHLLPKEAILALYKESHAFIFNPDKIGTVTNLCSDKSNLNSIIGIMKSKDFYGYISRLPDKPALTDYLDSKLYKFAYSDIFMDDTDLGDSYSYGYNNPSEFVDVADVDNPTEEEREEAASKNEADAREYSVEEGAKEYNNNWSNNSYKRGQNTVEKIYYSVLELLNMEYYPQETVSTIIGLFELYSDVDISMFDDLTIKEHTMTLSLMRI